MANATSPPGDRGREGAPVAGERPFHPAGRAHDHQPAVAGPDHERLVVGPGDPPPTPHSAVTTTAGPKSPDGATTRSARPSACSTHARRLPDGDQRGSLTLRDRLSMEGMIDGVTERRR